MKFRSILWGGDPDVSAKKAARRAKNAVVMQKLQELGIFSFSQLKQIVKNELGFEGRGFWFRFFPMCWSQALPRDDCSIHDSPYYGLAFALNWRQRQLRLRVAPFTYNWMFR